MTQTLSRMLATAAATAAVAGAMLLSTPAQAQEVVVYPPAAYVATTEPVYFEGHAAYWYGNHWHYRGADGRWAYYHQEPAFLHERRGRIEPARHYYDHHEVRRGEYRR